jgi:hypothetical protein
VTPETSLTDSGRIPTDVGRDNPAGAAGEADPGNGLRSVVARADVALAGASLFQVPRPKPSRGMQPVAGSDFSAQLIAEPRPMARPVDRSVTKAGGIEELVQVAAIVTQPAPSITTGRQGALCGDPSIRGTVVPGITSRINGCGMGAGAKISSIEGIAMSPAVTVDCPTALALRAWITDGLRPAVGQRGGGVRTIEVLGGYDCRPVNNRPGNRISEHGRGNAIDISGFILADGEVIRVLWHWGKGKQGQILKAMHWAACNDFGTVLGPAANTYHRNHFHFDTARRRSSYCR